jgi:hypothetical protein
LRKPFLRSVHFLQLSPPNCQGNSFVLHTVWLACLLQNRYGAQERKLDPDRRHRNGAIEVVASGDKQCITGKYKDSDEGYRISFVAERKLSGTRHLRTTSRTLDERGCWQCASGLGKSFSQLQFCPLRAFACE